MIIYSFYDFRVADIDAIADETQSSVGFACYIFNMTIPIEFYISLCFNIYFAASPYTHAKFMMLMFEAHNTLCNLTSLQLGNKQAGASTSCSVTFCSNREFL